MTTNRLYIHGLSFKWQSIVAPGAILPYLLASSGEPAPITPFLQSTTNSNRPSGGQAHPIADTKVIMLGIGQELNVSITDPDFCSSNHCFRVISHSNFELSSY